MSRHQRPLRSLLAIVCLSWLLAPGQAYASDEGTLQPWLLRLGLGGGYTFNQFEAEDDLPHSQGGAVAWDLAVGRRLAPWLGLHGSAFGSHVPNATVSRPLDKTTGSFLFQALGGGATFTASWGGFLSPSLGVASIFGTELPTSSYGVAAQLLAGFHVPVNEHLGVGVALRAGGVVGFDSWTLGHGACLLSLNYE